MLQTSADALFTSLYFYVCDTPIEKMICHEFYLKDKILYDCQYKARVPSMHTWPDGRPSSDCS